MTESRTYLDANVFIYGVEGGPEIADPLHELFELFRGRRGTGVTSGLTLAEVLARATVVRRRTYLSLIVWSHIFELQPVSREVLIETAEYRERRGCPSSLTPFMLLPPSGQAVERSYQRTHGSNCLTDSRFSCRTGRICPD